MKRFFSFLTAICIVIGVPLHAQSDNENTVVTIVKYFAIPLNQVEGGSADERKELMEEFHKKVTKKQKGLLSEMNLSHYWSGTTGEWTVISEFKSFGDIDDTDERNALIDKAWPDEEERKTFFKKFNKYWVGDHEDVGIYTHFKNLQRKPRHNKENTVVSISRFRLRKWSQMEDASGDELKQLNEKWHKNITKKSKRILSQMVLGHRWSGHARDIFIVSEFATMEDADDFAETGKLVELGWPDEEERKKFTQRRREYWGGYEHEDFALLINHENVRKR